ncbi:hypothetical protein CHBNII7_09630 [Haemophilus influenzae]|nr:hypothetical protein CHBNII7_09630 [Haemophilus influenzae]
MHKVLWVKRQLVWHVRQNSSNKPVIAIAGCLREDYDVVFDHGIDAVFPIIHQLGDLSDILKQGEQNLISTAQNVARVLAFKFH